MSHYPSSLPSLQQSIPTSNRASRTLNWPWLRARRFVACAHCCLTRTLRARLGICGECRHPPGSSCGCVLPTTLALLGATGPHRLDDAPNL